MKILLCPDKFKGSISADGVCRALAKGLSSVNNDLEILHHPMADGGDGSIDILKPILNLHRLTVHTTDPIGRPIVTDYYHTEDTAFIEMASASGLVLLSPSERNPMLTTTRGTGLMMKDAIKRGFQKIYLFIGGSATNDAGIGIAHALGYDFLSADGSSIDPRGGHLHRIDRITYEPPAWIRKVDITVLCDVINPMHGPNGAAHVYGPQKGASSKEILILDHGLKAYASALTAYSGRDLSDVPGMGAAGAVSASLVGLLDAHMLDGFAAIADLTQLHPAIQNADYVITGEGKIDTTSFQGKVVGNVLSLCQKYGKPCGVIGGMIEHINELNSDITFKKSIMSLAKDVSMAMATPEIFLEQIGREIGQKL